MKKARLTRNPKRYCVRGGFHACTNPIDVFTYYPPATSVYHEVELDDVSKGEEEDTKICGRKIKIGKQLNFNDMIHKGFEISMQLHGENIDNSHAVTVDYNSPAATSGVSSPAATSGVSSHAATSGDYSHAVTSGDYSPAATSGKCSPASTSGVSSPAATSGVSSPAATSGDSSHAVTSGKCSPASTSGDYSIAAAIGRNSKAKSTIGNWIVLAEYGEWNGKTYPVLCVKCGKIDGVSLKPDTYYQLKNGGFVEV